jgi:integrase
MALYLPKYRASNGTMKSSKVYWFSFRFQGQEIRESTGTRSITLARRIQDKRRRDLEEGAAGVRPRPHARLLSFASEAYLDLKKATLASSSLAIEKLNLKFHLLPVFGRMLVCDIEASDISKYQQARLKEEAAASSINLEIATLRAILKRHGQWERIQKDVKMLQERTDVGRALTADEEKALLHACSLSRSRCLLPFVTTALETGARFNVVRILQWGNIDFKNRYLKFGKDKTPSGTGRVVPLNPRALATLEFWASEFPNRKSEHFVFPHQRYAGGGKKDHFGFTSGMTYDLDVTRPLNELKDAWERAKLRAAKILKGVPDDTDEEVQPLICRFHDLRHTAVSRMLGGGVPIMKVAKIVGWSASTMMEMASRYGHFTLDELRGAVETISRAELPKTSPSQTKRVLLIERITLND